MMVDERLLVFARSLLSVFSEKDAMDNLRGRGVSAESAFLAVKGAKILREPYSYQGAPRRMVHLLNDKKAG